MIMSRENLEEVFKTFTLKKGVAEFLHQLEVRKEAHIYLKALTDFEGFWNRINNNM
ncbi:MAG: hypothetical protein ACI4DQ_07145 [Lachnospiraceae bacterium]